MVVSIDFKNKLVLITGGGRGLGVDIARKFAEAGANLALTCTHTAHSFDPRPRILTHYPAADNSTPADALAADLSKEFSITAKAYKMAAADTAQIDESVAAITSEMGEIDVVIANAGICIHVESAKCTDAQFRDTFETNTFFPYFLSRACYKSWFPEGSDPSAKKDKSILFVSSISGTIVNTPQPQSAYNASKAALTHLGKSLALEWVDKGIRVNILSPGYIGTG